MNLNGIAMKDVVPASYNTEHSLVSSALARHVNPSLPPEEERELTEEERTIFRVYKLPPNATVAACAYDFTDTLRTGLYVTLDKAKPAQLFGIPRDALIAYNNGGLDAKIANARRPGDIDKLVWERTMLHLEIARLAHQAAQTYCVGKDLSAAVNPFEGERIRMANEWLSALMGGPLPERLNFDAETVRRLAIPT